MKRKCRVAAALCALLVMMLPMHAFAGSDDVYSSDSVGNSFAAGEEVVLSGDTLDAFAAGNDVTVSGVGAAGNVAAAGNKVTINDVKANGTMFLAGNLVTVDNIVIDHNIIAVGNSISFGPSVQAAAIYAGGTAVSFDGNASVAAISGQYVYINGTFAGDVNIEGETVKIGPNAHFGGDVAITAAQEPTIEGGNLSVDGNYSFSLNPEYASETQQTESIGSMVADYIGDRIYWILAMFIVAMALVLMCAKNVEDAVEKTVEHPVALMLWGMLGFVAPPVTILILLFTYIGLPAAGITLVLYCLILFVAQTFTGMALGRLVLRKVFRFRILSYLAGVFVLLLLETIPWIGFLVNIACAVYAFGYLVLKIGDNLSYFKNTAVKKNTPAVETVEEAESSVVDEQV